MSDFPQTENTPQNWKPARLILAAGLPQGTRGCPVCPYERWEVSTFLPWFPLVERAGGRERLFRGVSGILPKPWGYRYAVCPKGRNSPSGIYVHLGGGTL